MELFLMRHARSDPPFGDESRGLGAEGRQQARSQLDYFKDNDLHFSDAYTSKAPRAKQTAQLLMSRTDAPLEEHKGLLRPEKMKKFVKRLQKSGQHVLAVGHDHTILPLVNHLAMRGDGERHDVDVPHASIVHLSGRPIKGGMTLKGIIPPKP